MRDGSMAPSNDGEWRYSVTIDLPLLPPVKNRFSLTWAPSERQHRDSVTLIRTVPKPSLAAWTIIPLLVRAHHLGASFLEISASILGEIGRGQKVLRE
jgi:hypothetical protein